MSKYHHGQTVTWKWGNGKASGKVQEIFTEHVTKTIKGSEITRNADNNNPAYLIKQDDGNIVLKSESELSTIAS